MDRGIDRDPGRRRPVGEPEGGGTRAREPVSDAQRGRGAELTALSEGIRWGAIWVGVVATLTIFLMLELLAFGLGLVSALDRPGNPGNENWLSAIVGLFAFLAGGYFAGITSRDPNTTASAIRGVGPGLLNGLLVWALGTMLILALCALGLGQIFGALGDVAGQSRALGEPGNVIDPLRVADTIRSSALGAFFSLLLWALASAVGGWLAGRTGTRAGRATGAERRRYQG